MPDKQRDTIDVLLQHVEGCIVSTKLLVETAGDNQFFTNRLQGRIEAYEEVTRLLRTTNAMLENSLGVDNGL